MPADTVGDTRPSDKSPVVAAVTFDQQGSQCLRQACQRAAHTGQPVIALHVVHENGRTAGHYLRSSSSRLVAPISHIAKGMLDDFVSRVLSQKPTCCHGLELRQLTVVGLPARRISEIAALTGADLLIMGGGRPKSGLQRLLSTSVTRAVLRNAPCPVLVIDAAGNPVDPEDLVPRGRGRTFPSMLQTH